MGSHDFALGGNSCHWSGVSTAVRMGVEVEGMRKVVLGVVLVCMLAGFVSGCSGQAAPKDEEITTAALNGTYKLGDITVTLVNGKFEKEAAPGSATKARVTVWGKPVLGDVNGDGWKEAVLVLVHEPGGTGTFYYVVVLGKNKSSQKYTSTNAVLLGDRIAPKNLSIAGGTITANYSDRKPNEPMTTQPSVDTAKKLSVTGETLKEVK